ncbi:Cyclin [Pelomyxa schiedti]|nr:Cyclin [Pelomyxa schiedti]
MEGGRDVVCPEPERSDTTTNASKHRRSLSSSPSGSGSRSDSHRKCDEGHASPVPAVGPSDTRKPSPVGVSSTRTSSSERIHSSHAAHHLASPLPSITGSSVITTSNVTPSPERAHRHSHHHHQHYRRPFIPTPQRASAACFTTSQSELAVEQAPPAKNSTANSPRRPPLSDLASRFLSHLLARSTREPVDVAPPSEPLLALFLSKDPSSVPLLAYTERLLKYAATAETLVLTLMYIDNLFKDHPAFELHEYNMHRLILTCTVISLKHWEDVFYSNEFYARVGGISLEEMNNLEISLLCLLGFNLFVSPQAFAMYQDSVAAPLKVRQLRNTVITTPPTLRVSGKNPFRPLSPSNSPPSRSPKDGSPVRESSSPLSPLSPNFSQTVTSAACCIGETLITATTPSPQRIAPHRPRLSYHKLPQFSKPKPAKS